MKIFSRLVLAAVVLTLAGAAWSQQVVQPPEGRIAVRVEMVNLLCSVLDRRGNYVTTLHQDDFIVYENNSPQKIENFSAMSDLPLSIALLIDTSASVANKLKFEQDAAAEFFATVLRPQDKALLVEFDTGVTLIQDFTNDTNLLGKQLRTLRAAGGTSLYDSVLLVAEEKLVPDQGERRKTVIVISDGEDTVSKVTFEEALEMAQRSGATVFAISTNKGGHFGVKGSDEGDTILEQLTSATGGKAYYPTKMEDLSLAFREINQELRSQYSISYRSSNPARDGTFRALRVAVKGKDLRVRHRKGYFAPKSSGSD
ncbi:MAG TPA: VWA domain-containing protein [Acidobacteriota bacterium]|jgi:Ca-activated chloride channel family protein|nr:VWA domain-containing protein [Acidobacteriota bacterium]HNR39275.1 VWA domain-containing protein [Acidobacteriota bacterium]HNU01790.1 VWA domain-containing protein [Acidobacteriota bacterium]HPB27287.1 VWA domain-containing protein [Acidobacteriota bacterium]HQO25592.1 VWA domain-containing protein [Acidobacteriota bacterium]